MRVTRELLAPSRGLSAARKELGLDTHEALAQLVDRAVMAIDRKLDDPAQHQLLRGKVAEQLKKLGASCDWDRTKFTMDDEMSESVLRVFVDLYSKGLIYRGIRMVNWDPQAQTAVSDEEVIYREVKSKLS